MKRIGIAASKISKGNRSLYYCSVVLISALFSFFIFVVAGATVIFALALIKHGGNEIMGVEFEKSWKGVLSACMVSLTVVIALFNIFAILTNLKPSKMVE